MTLPATTANQLPSDVIIPILSFLSLTLYELLMFRRISKRFRYAIDTFMLERKDQIKETLTAHGLNLNDPLYHGIMKNVPAFLPFDQKFTLKLKKDHLEKLSVLSNLSDKQLDRLLGHLLEKSFEGRGPNYLSRVHSDIKKYILNNFNYKKDLIELIEVLVNVPENPPQVDVLRPIGLKEYHRTFVPKPLFATSIMRRLFPVAYKYNILALNNFLQSPEIEMRTYYELKTSCVSLVFDSMLLHFMVKGILEKFGKKLSVETKESIVKELPVLILPLISIFSSPSWPILKYLDHLTFTNGRLQRDRIELEQSKREALELIKNNSLTLIEQVGYVFFSGVVNVVAITMWTLERLVRFSIGY